MTSQRPRLLHISSVLPDTSCGAHIAIYRHFVLKKDFDVAVAGYVSDGAMVQDKFTIRRNPLFGRFFRTRFSRIAYNIEYLLNWYVVPPGLLAYAQQFKPDAIFTVPDNMHSGLARGLSKRLGVPLIADFQDLFPLSRFIPRFMEPYEWVRKSLLKKTFSLNNTADLAFYTSEGMLNFFEGNKNAHVLYPVGDFDITRTPVVPQLPGKPLKLVYAGNCYGAYGRMLLSFARLVKNSPDIHLKIFPVGKGWTDDDISEMREAGIYQSFMPFAELRKELASCDAFLTVMSFEKEEEPFVRTSFTTKWLDYAPFAKPIFVWGPEYSSGVVFARKYNCGAIATDPSAETLVKVIHDTVAGETGWLELGKKAREAADGVLNPELIHGVLVKQVTKLLTRS
jgi:hypothetical protein